MPTKPVPPTPGFSMTVNLPELIDSLDFAEERTAEAILNQSKLLLKASHYRVNKLRARMKAEAAMELVRAKTALLIRGNSEGKITEAFIKETVECDGDVQIAQRAYDEAKAAEEWGKQLIEAYQMRGSMLKALVQLLGAEAAVESGFVRTEMERMGVGQLREKVMARYKKEG